jgi:ribosomal subunit interface protein
MSRQFYGKNLEITESLQEYLNTKLDTLYKLTSEVLSCRVDISRDTHHNKGDVFRVEINFNIPGKLLRVVELRPDAREAIDLTVNKLMGQLRVQKNKKLWQRKLSSIFKRT